MEKSLTSMLLMIGGFIGAVALLALLYPSIVSMGNAIAADRAGVSAQSRQAIEVVNVLSELDGGGTWQDNDSDTLFDAWVWVKNTGGVTISKTGETDLFVHTSGLGERIPHADDTAGYRQFTAAVEGGGAWLPGATLKLSVHYATALADGNHIIEVTTALGARDAGIFEL